MAPDTKVLFPEVAVAGFQLRPWTLGQTVALAPTLGALLSVLKGSEVVGVVDRMLDAVDVENATVASVSVLLKDEWKRIIKSALDPALFPNLIPLAPKILSVSLGASDEEVSLFDLGKTLDLLKAIAAQNRDYLKNYYGPERDLVSTEN